MRTLIMGVGMGVPGLGRRVVGVVLAGGEGRRLRPLTYYFQKCMIPIGSYRVR